VIKFNAKARRFYARFGFQEIGEIPFKADLAEIGMVVMAYELSRLEDFDGPFVGHF